MPAEPIIRRAAAADSDRVAATASRLLEELSDGAGGRDLEQLAAVARELLQDGAVAAWLALDDVEGRPVGLITVNACAAIYAGGRFGEISELYVDPDYRSSGLGQRLIDAACDFARAKGWPRLEVGAPDLPRWRRTVDFYRRCGFEEVGPRLKLILDRP